MEVGPLDLLVSDDGAAWRKHAQISAPLDGGNSFTEESDLYWHTDGEMWCVVRTVGSAKIYWSRPPYKEWHGGTDLGHWIHAPSICRSGEHVYVTGRHAVYDDGKFVGIAVALYHLTREKAILLKAFERAEDCSYPGLISPAPGKLVMSYFSDRAYCYGNLRPKHVDRYQRKYFDSDIYLAEIDVGRDEESPMHTRLEYDV